MVKGAGKERFPQEERESTISSVRGFLMKNSRLNPFKVNHPGDVWLKVMCECMCLFTASSLICLLARDSARGLIPYDIFFTGFLRRHLEIVEGTIEPVTSAISCVSEANIRNWFAIKEKKLKESMSDPSRIFNRDKMGFQICPSTCRVLATKGAKNVHCIEKGSSKENITVMFTFSVDVKTY
jgi:hypothetical protein